MPLFRGSSRFESLILSRHSKFTCQCNQEEINDDDDERRRGGWGTTSGAADKLSTELPKRSWSSCEAYNLSTKLHTRRLSPNARTQAWGVEDIARLRSWGVDCSGILVSDFGFGFQDSGFKFVVFAGVGCGGHRAAARGGGAHPPRQHRSATLSEKESSLLATYWSEST